MSRSIEVAAIPGDGIGPEVLRIGRSVLDRAVEATGDEIRWTELPWGSEHYVETGRMMPPEGLDVLSEHDAIYLGAVGDPRVSDHVAVGGLILPIRRGLDLYVNHRPVRWLPGAPARLAGKSPEDVDILFVRENVEGEYVDAGGRTGAGTPGEIAVQTAVFTRRGIERIARYALERARRRDRHLVSVTKSNALAHSMVLWDEVVSDAAAGFPDVEVERMHVDAAAYHLVMAPERFDVVVAGNLFGDILTDLGAALQGSLGLAASANLDPSGRHPSMFEPVHGSAPDIAGRGIANPAGAIWAGALMLEHLGLSDASDIVMAALEHAIAAGALTADLGGTLDTEGFGKAVIVQIDDAMEEARNG